MFHTARFLAQHGYVAASASYRLRYSDGATPFDCVDDAKAAYRWLWEHADRFHIDPTRIAVAGSSAGGHLAAAVALVARPDDPPDPPAAMLLFNAALDTSFETPTEARLQYIEDEFEQRGVEISPTHHIHADAPPAIVFHGTADGVIPFEHARIFCDRMRRAGNDCELVPYPEAGHGFYNMGMPLVDDANAKLLAFLAREHITGAEGRS
jgi:acetyl esterase/lipase